MPRRGVRKSKGPDPATLLDNIKQMMRERSEEYYTNQPRYDDIGEGDEAISILLNNILHNAE